MHHYRLIHVWLLLLLAPSLSKAQQHFSATLRFPESVQSQQIKVFYDNGINDNIAITDTLINNQLNLSGLYFSKFVTIIIAYPGGTNRLWISEKPARIQFEVANEKLQMVALENAIDIDNSESFKQISQYTLSERENIEDFISKNKTWYTKDSLITLYTGLNKKLAAKKVEYISNHPNSYYSFWIFRRELVYVDYNISDLMNIYNQVFDDTLKSTREGEEIAIRLNGRAVTKGRKSPDFSSKNINNEDVKLQSYQGKHVIITFWASWCGPCIAEFPQLKKIRQTYSPDSLAFIFVSLDQDKEKFNTALKKYDILGTHIYNDIELLKRFGVMTIPQVYLIDKNGFITYSRADQPDNNLAILEKALTTNLKKN